MEQFKKYRKSAIAEMRPYINGESMDNITVSPEDIKDGSPKSGDMIARNPNNHNDQWLVSEQYFKYNYIGVSNE